MADPFVGEIRIVGFNFAPTGWALCDGQLMAISQNTALFSLLGTMYGGDGKSTFALPDFQGRAAMDAGTGSGLTARTVGDKGGAETIAVTVPQLPPHRHVFRATAATATTSTPTSELLAEPAQPSLYGLSGEATQMYAASVVPAGGSYPHNNMMPYLTMDFIIALQGIFPSRN